MEIFPHRLMVSYVKKLLQLKVIDWNKVGNMLE